MTIEEVIEYYEADAKENEHLCQELKEKEGGE